jgi:hypothetical protein
LFNLALRQVMGMAQGLLKLAGLAWQVPDFSTVSWRQKDLPVTIAAQMTTTGLHFLVDSTGIKMLGEGEWKTKKHGADYRRKWRKVHLGTDAATLKIRAIEVTDNANGDAPMLPYLLDQIPADKIVASVSGDGAYDTKGCHEAIANRGAQAISLLARTPGRGRTSDLVPRSATPSWRPRADLAGKSGRSGVPITGGALSRPRCEASSCFVNAPWRVTLTARSPNCKSVPPSLIGSPGWAHPRLRR